MVDHIKNREIILKSLKEELVGPSPTGAELDCNSEVIFNDIKQSYKPWVQKGTKEEIIQRDSPSKRFGIGVLYPLGKKFEQELREPGFISLETSLSEEKDDKDDVIMSAADRDLDELKSKLSGGRSENESDDLDLSIANSYKPSSMAITFLVDLPKDSRIIISASGGRYFRKVVKIQERERDWWLRSPVSIKAEFSQNNLISNSTSKVTPTKIEFNNADGLNINLEVFSRPTNNINARLLTVCLVNRSESIANEDESCLFQAGFNVTVVCPDEQPHIMPYPRSGISQLDEEEQGLVLLYRNCETFAVGHGCAANWEVGSGKEKRAISVSAESLPSFETPSITPDIQREDGSDLKISMAKLAGLVDGDNGIDSILELVRLYESWIAKKYLELSNLGNEYRSAGKINMQSCVRCVNRMKAGINYLLKDPIGLKAFQFANYAVLLQQLRGRREPRHVHFDSDLKKLNFAEPYQEINLLTPPQNLGNWRAFQIGFLLSAIESTANGSSSERETVELIWFPTGGGKTEAYFGLAAFSMFIRRLRDKTDTGVNVLMRYTLRLLTAQQFQRASGLICAMEYIRRQNPEQLGIAPFSIGIWLGSDTTPNTRTSAIEVLRALHRGDRDSENKLLVSRCPWCGAQMGPITYHGKKPRSAPRVIGYEQEGGTVVFRCPDTLTCPFSDKLPIYVIDQDIYDFRPSLVIGTVDKFAMLPWRPESRSLFGLSENGNRVCSPPGLIIQDELHLISGPLGSLVGLYEVVIEELCTDRRNKNPILPKIISSTATIRRYKNQIKALYGRSDVTLFPPPGLAASDSFFARYARKKNGELQPGRIYIGIHAPGLGSVQTAQVRSLTAMLQSPVILNSEERDPWWTMVVFFNSLRELGTTVSLFQSDIPDYMKVIKNRYGLDYADLRKLWNIKELTGRLRNDDVPAAIDALEVPTTSKGAYPVDVCLASNIFEVGIDVDRLSLMTVVGQPKSTSQYIQVTGRIGRKWGERPGLVATIYSPSKPRDRSHFEKFRSYHERLYEQVEPTSLTPFSAPALDRALHAVMAAYVRQAGDKQMAQSPNPCPVNNLEFLRNIIVSRVESIDPEEVQNVKIVFNRRIDEWKKWQRTRWSATWDNQDAPLLREAGGYVMPDWVPISWPTPTSMRNVDAECQIEITRLYLLEEEAHA